MIKNTSILVTERLILRPFLKSDYQDYYEYMSLKEIYRFERGKPVPLKEAKKMCAANAKTKNYFAVTLKENNKVIGQVVLSLHRPSEFRTWNLSYILNPAYQCKGYATEAARTLVEYGFKELKAHRIIGHCSPDNTTSWKILEKVGMKKEGLSRRDFLVRTDENGKPFWLDSLEYAILEDDAR